MALTLSDGVRQVTARGEAPQRAKMRPTTPEEARERIQKTGGTLYAVTALEVEAGEGLMAPAAQLNALRREALEELTAPAGPASRPGAACPLPLKTGTRAAMLTRRCTPWPSMTHPSSPMRCWRAARRWSICPWRRP